MPYNYLVHTYQSDPSCGTDCLCNACYENQPDWAWALYVYAFLVLNVLLLVGTIYCLFVLWKTATVAVYRNMRVLVFVLLHCIIRIADQLVFMKTYDQVGLFDYLGAALACMAVLLTAVNVKYALDAASARPSSTKLTIFVILMAVLISIILFLGILGGQLELNELFIVSTVLLAVLVVVVLGVSTKWMLELRFLLRTHAAQTDTESALSLTSTEVKIRTTLLIFYFCGVLGIASAVYHAAAQQEPYQWMVSWWLPRVCCFIAMARLVMFYKPETKPDEPKITRLSCHSPPSRTSSNTKPSPMLHSASTNNLECSEPATPSTLSSASNSGTTPKFSPFSLSTRKLDVPSAATGVEMAHRRSASKLSVLSVLVKEQEEDSATTPISNGGDDDSLEKTKPPTEV